MITVAATCYGDYWRHHGNWLESLERLNTPPAAVLVEDSEPAGPYPQAELLNRLVAQIETEYVWFLGLDNQALPDALDDLDVGGADALLFGFRRTDGAEYRPAPYTNTEFLALRQNRWPSDSLFRTDAVRAAGGFPVIGHEDWGLWRAMCRLDMTVRATGRVHWLQQLHDGSRTSNDIAAHRGLYLEEVLAA